ncbi:MAG: hypothetical protein AAF658_00925 [Myxococcota bacterium]
MRQRMFRASLGCAGMGVCLVLLAAPRPALAQDEADAITTESSAEPEVEEPSEPAPEFESTEGTPSVEEIEAVRVEEEVEVEDPVQEPEFVEGENLWYAEWGLIFMLTGLGGPTNGVTGPLNPTDGFGASGVWFLDDRTAVRVGLDTSRTVDPRDFTQQTIRNADGEVITLSLDDFGDTDFDVELGVDYLIRMTDAEISPYYGVGAFTSYNLFRRAETDDVTIPETEIEVDINNHDLDLGVRGILGVDWRVHDQISLFAEYVLSLTLFDIDSNRQTTTTRSLDNGEVVGEVGERTVSEQTSWLPFDLGEGHAGRVGVMFHF